MEIIFQLCVKILYYLAEQFNTDYYTINVVIFCFIGPAVYIFLIVYIHHLRTKLRKISKKV